MTRDPLDELGTAGFEAQDPGLAQLFSDLASPPLEGELAGRQAALSMFRAVRAEQAERATGPVAADAAPPAQTRVLGSATGKPTRRSAKSSRHQAGPTSRRPGPTRRPAGQSSQSSQSSQSRRGAPVGPGAAARPVAPVKKARVGGRLVAFALVLAFAGSFAAAGYAAVLPAPLQRVAHQILGVVGVPDSPNRQTQGANTPPASGTPTNQHSRAGSPSPSLPNSPSPRPSHHKSPKHKPHSPSPHPSSPGRSTGLVQIVIAASQQKITAGQGVQITASLTRQGKAAAGIKVSLLELAAGPSGQKGGPGGQGGQTGWQVVATAVTDDHGQATFTVPDLTTDARFRVTGPGGAASSPLPVIVVPPITATLESGPNPNTDLLVASSPLAQRGDTVELEADMSGQWQVVHVRRLGKNGQVTFNLPLRKSSVTYQVVLPATQAHAESVSAPVAAPARPHSAKKAKT